MKRKRNDACARSDFVLDERRLRAIRDVQPSDVSIPEDLRRFFGVAPNAKIPTTVLEAFWRAMESESRSMRAVLRRYHDKQSDHRGLFSILGDERQDRNTVGDFLRHLRSGNPAFEAALDAYNDGSWIRHES
ncbi:hypothetical protein CYMTET_54265 [Cymbomonas tetramitiformis]|uniref:Uncharacterized protein n=1 Tax=Cymbomonas tetramitiformis TaxID=36881 RepID=A0AAE0BFC4_9CHLO|nr:hypothetical protein CYMTET_54265 [Cymbomonas tetramitiformis]|eukprot:gene4663-5708_t